MMGLHFRSQEYTRGLNELATLCKIVQALAHLRNYQLVPSFGRRRYSAVEWRFGCGLLVKLDASKSDSVLASIHAVLSSSDEDETEEENQHLRRS